MMARETHDSSSPPNKRLKTVNPQMEIDDDDPNQPPETPNSPAQNCSICYLDNEKSARGQIDCCDHYYCFLCIKEWAKTESRCPMCRRRFSTIRRRPKHGVFVRERVVKVPVRDQGKGAGYVDNYEEVACNVCSLMTDDYLMLLCDRCDGAAHTYCVGLGYTVPEDEWYCHDCIACSPELGNADGADDGGFIPTEDAPVPCPSASDIVRESRPCISESLNPNQTSDITSSAFSPVSRLARAPPRVVSISTESVARTLDRCRNVQTRIHTLRENWNDFRSGVLSFPASSSKLRSGCSSSQGRKNGAVSHGRSSQTQSTPSPGHAHLENRDSSDSYDIDRAWKMLDRAKPKQHNEKNSSAGRVLQFSKLPSSRARASEKPTNKNPCSEGRAQYSSSADCQERNNQVHHGSHGIEKAWKMMDRAKLKQQIHVSTSSAPKLLSRKAIASEEAQNANSSFDMLECHQLGAGNHRRTGVEMAYKGKEVPSGFTTRKAVESILGISCSNSSPGLFISPSLRNVSRSTSLQLSPASPHEVNERHTSTSGNLDLHKGEKGYMEREARKLDDNAKSEIQSLVKMNLKILSRDEPLEADAFRKIARAATHTVLAGCGSEHQKYAVRSSSSLICRHTEQFQLPQPSNLKSKACRDCFYGFVKDVVTSILQNHDGFRLPKKQKL